MPSTKLMVGEVVDILGSYFLNALPRACDDVGWSLHPWTN